MTIKITTRAALDALPVGAKIKVKTVVSETWHKAYSTTLTKTQKGNWADGSPILVWANTTGHDDKTFRFNDPDSQRPGLAAVTGGRFVFGMYKTDRYFSHGAEITLLKPIAWDVKKTDLATLGYKEGYFDKSKTFFIRQNKTYNKHSEGPGRTIGWTWGSGETQHEIDESDGDFSTSIKEAKKKAEESVIAKVRQANIDYEKTPDAKS